MADLPHLPVLRGGRVYESLDTVELASHRDGTPLATVSQANAGMIRRDLKKAGERAAKLRAIPIADLLECCKAAARIFMEDEVSLGTDGSSQTTEQYVAALSATSGLPHTLCRRNMEKVAGVMREMPTILRGLMRGMDPAVLDGGIGEHGGVPVWYTPNADALGAVLPSNSPGVHSLWVPSIALKTPVVLKPGREEPWTPMRVAQSMIAAGIPAEAFSLYPTDHEGAATVLQTCGRSLLFGDARTTEPYANDPSVEIHGPGRSKVLLGADEVENWREHLDVLVASVADNGGRSCINASAIFVPAHAGEIAAALAERLSAIEPRPADDDAAALAAFANPAFAEMMDAAIDQGLASGGARELTARPDGRRVEVAGSTYLLPTVVHCDSLEHPLANTEYLFPFTSVVEVPQDEMLASIGPTLVCTAITKDEPFLAGLTTSADIHRLNLGPVPTSRVEWDQPHEGNLFEFLYSRRALQRASAW
jgi:acyl-CoA reductase-like NAD-dependent aldehyde dehydrogenase